MCLIIKKGSRLKVATKDIVVYKRVNFTTNNKQSYGVTKDGKAVIGSTCSLISGTRRFRYRFGVDYSAQLQVVIKRDGDRLVEKGFHSFTSLRGAIKAFGYGSHIVECVIPKGSLYYEGSNNGDSKGIASDAIRLISFHK